MTKQLAVPIQEEKKRYENRKQAKVLTVTKGGSADFIAYDDNVVTLDRFHKKRRLNEAEKKDEVVKGIQLLQTHNISVTSDNVRKFSIGSRTVNKYYAAVLQELAPQDEKKDEKEDEKKAEL